MNIVHVNNTDLSGRRFNGHDLQLSLNQLGHRAYQLVAEKQGKEETTIALLSSHEMFVRSAVRSLERQLSTNNLLFPFGKKIAEHPIVEAADLVHYHLIHNHFISVFDYPELFKVKPSVWTIHDPWAITGHCVHPRECDGWLSGCQQCPQLHDASFPMLVDRAAEMWAIKQQIYQNLDVDIIVASRLMMDYVRRSPILGHIQRIHHIPFGIQVEQFQRASREQARRRWEIPADEFVIAFRADANEIKGLKYILEMLEHLTTDSSVTLLIVGEEKLPAHLAQKFRVIELGWQNDQATLFDFYASSDVFVMPSIAESFGLMAIEAMASGCAVIVFEETVLPEITFAPECGIAVPYMSGIGLSNAVQNLIEHRDECRWRGEQGKALARVHYHYDNYLAQHISLYEEVLTRQRRG